MIFTTLLIKEDIKLIKFTLSTANGLRLRLVDLFGKFDWFNDPTAAN